MTPLINTLIQIGLFVLSIYVIGFIIAIINPDLTVDYHIPALNIYYINKNCWIKR